MWFVLILGCERLMVALVYCGVAASHRLLCCSFSVHTSYLGADDAVVSLQWAATMANLLHLVYLTIVTQLISPITTWFPELPWLNLQTIWSAPPLLTPHSTTESWNLTLQAQGNGDVLKRYLDSRLIDLKKFSSHVSWPGWCIWLIPSMFMSSISLLFKHARKLASPNTCTSSWSQGILLWVL